MKTKKTDIMSLFASPNKYAENGFTLQIIPKNRHYWMHDTDVNLGDIKVSFKLPGNMTREELALKAVQTLRDKKDAERANSQKRITELEKKINELLLITHDGDSQKKVTELQSDVIDVSSAPFSDGIPF